MKVRQSGRDEIITDSESLQTVQSREDCGGGDGEVVAEEK